ncbi:MAG: hypothetical protein ACOYMX_02140 [Burkholderiales bacterium]|nr:hypothetical protein [Betaproteobacteria bacterium]
MLRLRDGLLPALILSLLLLQYAAVGHVLAHMGFGHHGVWAGAPLADDEPQPGQQPGGCEAPQLHAVIDGSPLAPAPAVPVLDAETAARTAFLLAVAERTPPQPLGRGPPRSL